MPLLRTAIALVLVTAAAAGCRTIGPEGKSPLRSARMSPDSVVLEIFFVRLPLCDAEAAGAIWQEIDEQNFPPEMRRKLTENGFRVGLVGGQIPSGLASLMELTDKPPPTGQIGATQVENLDTEPRVVRRHLQLRAGKRSEIMASGVYDEWPVLRCESGKVFGKTYQKAQGILAVKAMPEPDGRVQIELTPELHYGDPRLRTVGDNGAMRLEAGRPRCALDDLAVTATLTPGHMLVLSSLTSRPGSLGHYFFTQDNAGQKEQKLLLVRLSQTQHDDLFAPQSVLPVDAAAP